MDATVRNYANKRISGATAGLAYNLGVAHAAITNAGICNADPDGAGAANYDFTDRTVYVPATNNLAKFTHHTVLANDPQTGIA